MLKRISIELVPRNWNYLQEHFKLIGELFPQIDTLNIPDLLRFPIRSWEVCNPGRNYFAHTIPHLRAIDFDLSKPFALKNYFSANSIDSVLVITGDKPQDMSVRVYRNTALELIRVLKKEMPELKVYAGIDPYRSSLREELDYIEDKKIAGADGFFTQPFFDLKLLEIYLDLLNKLEVFWGICPVLSDKSKNYWESKNNVVFPTSFRATMEWNTDFAREALKIIGEYNSNVYFMPIQVPVAEYLQSVFRQ